MATKKTPETATPSDVEVRIHGVLIANVHSYDVAKGEVWCHDGVDPSKAVELKTGTVSVVAKEAAKGNG